MNLNLFLKLIKFKSINCYFIICYYFDFEFLQKYYYYSFFKLNENFHLLFQNFFIQF